MKLILSLGSSELILEPQTDFEIEMMKKYFQEKDVSARIDEQGKLWIHFSGAAGS